MKDKRSVKTERAIREAFLLLMKDKNLNQITVTQISKTAELGRGTFYLHYRDVYDLYEHIEKELYDDFIKFFNMAYPSNNPTNLVTLTDNITEYIAMQQDLFNLMIQNKNNGNILEKLKKIFYKKVIEESIKISEEANENFDYEKGEAIFVVSGVIGVLEEWVKGNVVATQKEISAILHCILLKI